MTSYSRHVTMKSVTVSELKAHLSAYLTEVRGGEVVVVCDRKTPIARLVPLEESHDALVISEPVGGDIRELRDMKSIRLSKKLDDVKLLREDRDRR